MNRFNLYSLLLFAAALFSITSCDETTDDIGSGLAGNMDNFILKSDTFLVQTQTRMLGAVQSRSAKANLGCIRDYDTGALIRGSYTTQFYLLGGALFPELDSIRSTNPSFETLSDTTHVAIEQVMSDSTYIYVVPTNIIGDSLQPMHLNVYELIKPIPDGRTYFSDFDPVKEGYVNTSKPLKSMTFTMADQTLDSATVNSKDYTAIFKIPLTDEYTKDGVTYNNLGSYIMQSYYKSKRDKNGAFANSNAFAHKVFPGIYVTVDNGEGAMASITGTGMNISYRCWVNDSTTRLKAHTTIFGTDEVLQTTYVETNKDALQALANDGSCSYLKTPAGLYTEMTIPVEQIMYGHETDSLSKAKVTFQCMNMEGYEGNTYKAPSYLLMIPTDSVQTFFNEKKLTDGRTAFLASYNSSTSSYTFDNFAGIVAYMENLKKTGMAGENWNKVALVPVTVSTTSSSSSDSYYYGGYYSLLYGGYYGSSSSSSGGTITAIFPEMGLSSAKLVGGPNAMDKTKISVVYTKMSD
ncbi:MAG: DUF4270 domain-containing protein [Bacteroidaceae bacterium]|nr:DUF4270 domain-containing protein [Bacteroidaceae bacterium]